MLLRNSLFGVFFLVLFFLVSNFSLDRECVYATLEIPKLDLEEKIYNKNSKYNDLKYGIYYLEDSSFLEEDNFQMILASHSGNARVSYFKNLDEININDEIRIKKENTVYLFKVIDKYYEEKDGKIAIKKPLGNSLALVTCTKNTIDLQTVVIAINIGKLEEEFL